MQLKPIAHTKYIPPRQVQQNYGGGLPSPGQVQTAAARQSFLQRLFGGSWPSPPASAGSKLGKLFAPAVLPVDHPPRPV